MVRVAIRESVTPEFVRDAIARGSVVLPANIRHLAGTGGRAPSSEWYARHAAQCSALTQARATASTTQVLTHAAAGPQGGHGHGRPLPQRTAGTISPTGPTAGGFAPSPFPLPNDFLYPTAPLGHPTSGPAAAHWVNQTVAQRRTWLFDPGHCRGEAAAKHLDPTAIGRPLTTKINANQGASPVSSNTSEELDKLRHAILYGADTVMDLSTGGQLDECRQAIIDHSVVPVGTVPIYSMILGRRIEELDYDTILRVIEHQAQQGVDYFTIHAGILQEHLPLIRGRITGLVSRGGSLLAKWMIHHGKQNPMYTLFDEISAIMREYDVTYSLGDGVRPGCLADASDPAQIAELHVLAELVQRARAAGVQVMVEGPGHVPLNEIAWNMEHQRAVCDDAPFYVLGPLVTDVFPGYDHITSAIGATEAARAGAAMLCYVTPKEHVGLPKAEDVKQGCIAYKIAAHAGDIARGVAGARQWDDDLSKARAALNWPKHFELAFDGETARALHDEDLAVDTDFCAMCGHDWCSMRISKEIEEWASGKHAGYAPEKRAAQSPGLTAEQQKLLAERAKGHKLGCHSDNAAEDEEVRRVQVELMR
ncbi:MAG: phosphomethylpyrimidine synthase ThiC [Phycisphaerales bacterium]|nr:phosphomethylpyrimidine synthase ThiC [Phycisphaerales bacterium]